MSAVIPLFCSAIDASIFEKIGSDASRERGRNRVPWFVGHTHSELARRFLLTYRIVFMPPFHGREVPYRLVGCAPKSQPNPASSWHGASSREHGCMRR